MQPKLIFPILLTASVIILTILALFRLPISDQQDTVYQSSFPASPAPDRIQPVDNPGAFNGLTLPPPSPDSLTPTPKPQPTPEYPVSGLKISPTPSVPPDLNFDGLILPSPTPTPDPNAIVPIDR